MDEDTNGYDTQIHTNVLGRLSWAFKKHWEIYTSLGHFYFTQLLLPLLLATAEASPVELKPRIITVSSSGHYLAPANPLDFNTFKSGPARKKRTTEDMYIQSKFVRNLPCLRFDLPTVSAGKRCILQRTRPQIRRPRPRVYCSEPRFVVEHLLAVAIPIQLITTTVM